MIKLSSRRSRTAGARDSAIHSELPRISDSSSCPISGKTTEAIRGTDDLLHQECGLLHRHSISTTSGEHTHVSHLRYNFGIDLFTQVAITEIVDIRKKPQVEGHLINLIEYYLKNTYSHTTARRIDKQKEHEWDHRYYPSWMILKPAPWTLPNANPSYGSGTTDKIDRILLKHQTQTIYFTDRKMGQILNNSKDRIPVEAQGDRTMTDSTHGRCGAI
ncbi:hypothetical protein Trydic_g14054 [Trypoxylus dichotomus]